MLEEDCVGGGLCWSRILLEGDCKCLIMCKIINFFFPLKLYAKRGNLEAMENVNS